MSKRMKRMLEWIEKNPYEIYGDRNDEATDKQANFLLQGDFAAFDESFFEVEINASDYTDWCYWQKEFAVAFGFESWDLVPKNIQEICRDNRFTDCSDLLNTYLNNWNGHVCARLMDSRGDFIEFPSPYEDESNAFRARYLSRYCGIKGDSEAAYDGTFLTALGRIDLLDIYKSQTKPEYVKLEKGSCFTIGVEPSNGSGTCNNDQFESETPRIFKAVFYVDGKRGYGVDSIFGLTGKCWQNNLHFLDAESFAAIPKPIRQPLQYELPIRTDSHSTI
jgi:hypothetical protein